MSFFLRFQPENILLDTKENQLKLIDFGHARPVEHRLSDGGGSSGHSSEGEGAPSPEFQAPEVISSGPEGKYTDMWGFGVLLYVALRYEI